MQAKAVILAAAVAFATAWGPTVFGLTFSRELKRRFGGRDLDYTTLQCRGR